MLIPSIENEDKKIKLIPPKSITDAESKKEDLNKEINEARDAQEAKRKALEKKRNKEIEAARKAQDEKRKALEAKRKEEIEAARKATEQKKQKELEAAKKAEELKRQNDITSGENHIYFAGAWLGYGFHEDGVKSAIEVFKKLDVEK